MKVKKVKNQAGVSLLELIIVLVIIGILAAFILPAFKTARNSGDGKKILTRFSEIIEERKSSAIRLNQSAINGGDRPDQPVIINFAGLSTTAPIKTDGADINRDGIEDVSGVKITRWGNMPGTGRKGWIYAYEGQPLQLPEKWKIIQAAEELGDIPQIENSELITSLGFNAEGKPARVAVANAPVTRDEAAFFVIYARDTASDDIAVALAVHGSGLTEKWIYNFEDHQWTGRGGRR